MVWAPLPPLMKRQNGLLSAEQRNVDAYTSALIAAANLAFVMGGNDAGLWQYTKHDGAAFCPTRHRKPLSAKQLTNAKTPRNGKFDFAHICSAKLRKLSESMKLDAPHCFLFMVLMQFIT